MGDFNSFKTDVVTKIQNLGQTTFAGLATQAISDTQKFFEVQAQNLATWTDDLATGKIDQDEFEFLVRGQLAVFEMHALTVAGIAAAQLQQFRDALVKIITDAAVKNFVPF